MAIQHESTVSSVFLCATREVVVIHSLGGTCAYDEAIVARILLEHGSTPRFCESVSVKLRS